ncbi:MAG: non-hydrolyzing UDP-N-acetylglucosamine 2-epimerase [Rhodospirillales bacterium]
MTAPLRILSVFGTRPEAVKMAPAARVLAARPGVVHGVCVTAQHRAMLDSALAAFGLRPDFDLDLMTENQSPDDILAAALTKLRPVLADWRPDRVLVHGDTTTTMAAALAAYHARVPVAHVEAGLRTGDRYAPFPEEINRRVADVVCDLHFAPTPSARENLLREGVDPAGVHVTGNTVIDALLWAREKVKDDAEAQAAADAATADADGNADGRKIILVTGHRRENFGPGFESICRALAQLGERGDVRVVYPAHLNPNVRGPAQRLLGGAANVRLIDPLPYLPFVALMDRAHIVLTDSGGVQEEAPSLGKPVLVMRDVTERPEAVEAGTAKLTGADTGAIVNACAELLDDDAAYAAMSRAVNPYGDGRAAERIAGILCGEAVAPWTPGKAAP